MHHQINSCRVCGNKALIDILDLGEQALTGIFPKTKTETISKGPLQLVKCDETADTTVCGLVQLKHSYQLGELYGDHYGYRSGLNQSMVSHLQQKVNRICEQVDLKPNDIIIDVGSNDATTLKAYPKNQYRLIGIDPTGKKFAQFYTDDIELIPDFFSADNLKPLIGNKKAKVITSFSMFYDLESPVLFAEQVAALLDEDGIWVCEQSYMPAMLAQNSFDTVCHEHIEYYGLRQMHWIAKKVGLNIIDVEFNNVNGGSFSVVFAKPQSRYAMKPHNITAILDEEKALGLDGEAPYRAFAERAAQMKKNILLFFKKIKTEGKTIYGLGASTKGNVLLQYCGLTTHDLPAVGEVNSDKFGSYTPGTLIPIMPESEIIAQKPDYLLVLPWHFKSFFESSPIFSDIALVYPLPNLEISLQKEPYCDSLV